ncbi:MAG: efflux RND transporter periplasmic adaptor subunit [bacterium]
MSTSWRASTEPVTLMLAGKGERVRKGQVIIQLDAEVLSAQLEEARAAASLAREQWERRERLWEEEEIGSEMEYIQARENARMQAARVRTLETRLAKRSIRSPINGTFENYYVEVGELAAPPSPIARVMALDRVKITGGVPERFANDVEPGTRVQVGFDALPGREVAARVSFVGDAVEPQARTFPVEMIVANPGRRLKPGMIAGLSIVRQRMEDVVVVPQETVVRTEEGYQVFVVEEGEEGPVARARSVTMGPSRANRVVITEGLEDSDLLVMVGQLKLGDGDRVKIVRSGGGEVQ